MKRFPLPLITTLIIAWLCFGFTPPVSADIVTNYIHPYTASDGSLALLVSLYDTVTSNTFKGQLTIFDKNNNKIVDEPNLGGYSDYAVADYTGKQLLQVTPEGVASFQRKYILYKVTSKGLKKINEQVVDYAIHAWIYKSFIAIKLQIGPQIGLTAFNSTLKKVLFSIPFVTGNMWVLPGKDIIYSLALDSSAYTVKYYKRGKQFAEQYLPLPSEGFLIYKVDPKGGMLHWYANGPLAAYTNLPLTYTTAKNKVQCKNGILEDAEADWHPIVWNGKYLYIRNLHSRSFAAYKITKSTVKMGEINEPGSIALFVDGPHVSLYTGNSCGHGLIGLDKNLNKKKWIIPCEPGAIQYIANGVFRRQLFVNNGSTGDDITLTYYRKGKIIATQTYLLPH